LALGPYLKRFFSGDEIMTSYKLPLITAVLVTAATVATAAEDWNVLPQVTDSPPQRLLYEHLQRDALQLLAQRRQAFEKLQTPDQCRAWQAERRQRFEVAIGEFPERCPLEPQIVGQLEGDGYRVEKIILQSRPGHHVTAALFLPEGTGPFPAVLVACGHSRTAKASDYNQAMCIALSQHGVAALCYDPIGQGERSQQIDAEGRPVQSGTTTEHFLIGAGSILVGRNTAHYRIYDGMRCLDYLAGRKDIAADKLGCTGCSGGGTMTCYLMALDNRIACAAPACYVTTFERLIQTIGPQDAEQNIFGQLAFGMEQTDYLLMRAPKPTLVCATTEDFFDITGTWDTARQAKRFYGWLEAPECVDVVEANGKHGIGPLGRRTMVQWMRRWLAGIDQPVGERELKYWTEAELRCTPRGQVLLEPGELSVYDLNAERAAALAEQRRSLWKAGPPAGLRDEIRNTIGARPLADLPNRTARTFGSVPRDGYRVDRLVLEADGQLPLACLRFVPDKPTGAAALILDGDGKAAQADGEPDAPTVARQLVQQGTIVLAVDLSGLGETSVGKPSSTLSAEWKEACLAYLIGRSLVGVRAEEVLAAARWAIHEQRPPDGRVGLVARGRAVVASLHAAALEPDLFADCRFENGFDSWHDLAGKPSSEHLADVVHAALASYDLPDLRAQLGDRLKH
jgi:dienelactone hydrolase